jgi:Arc/MetJ-type ribon-helix-helix transcriptional regulator
MRAPDSEKLTLNLGFVDLGHIDLLVRDGFYANRSDFIRTAVRDRLRQHAEVTARAVERRGLQLGIAHLARPELEAAVEAGTQLEIRVLGLLTIAPDVDPALARRAIGSITVLGALHAPATIRQALADRIS